MSVEILLATALVIAIAVIAWLLVDRSRPRVRVAAASASSDWTQRSESGRFVWTALPRSEEAQRLEGAASVFYGEFDTTLEPDTWREYLYDPLKVLRAEGIPLPSDRLHITMVKLQGDGVEPSPEYVRLVEERAAVTRDQLARAGEPERDIMITTTIVNHEKGLNPRVVQTYF
jgi:hypothetical protein